MSLLVTKTFLDEGLDGLGAGWHRRGARPGGQPGPALLRTLWSPASGICDEDAVRVLVTEGPQRVRELIALGAKFERTLEGEIALTREGGHHRDRIAHAGGDATGREISRALIEALHAVQEDPTIEVVEHALVLDLLTDAAGRAVRGDACTSSARGSVTASARSLGRAVVLATGGLGQVFASTTNPPVSTGDGVGGGVARGGRGGRPGVRPVPPDRAVAGPVGARASSR